jgi:hypothetical protein
MMAATFMRANVTGLRDIIMAVGVAARNAGLTVAREAQASYESSEGNLP